MKYIYPPTFIDYDSWVEYSEDQRRIWESLQVWNKFTPEKWIESFPEMKDRVLELYFGKEDLLLRLKLDYANTQLFFSQDLNTRLFEEALLDETLGKIIKRLESKLKIYQRMLSTGSVVNLKKIYNQNIDVAREYPIVELLSEIPKRGFIHCPFHNEKTPSCKVFPNHIHCYGCGKHLDSIGYLMEVEGKTFINSVKYLCKI